MASLTTRIVLSSGASLLPLPVGLTLWVIAQDMTTEHSAVGLASVIGMIWIYGLLASGFAACVAGAPVLAVLARLGAVTWWSAVLAGVAIGGGMGLVIANLLLEPSAEPGLVVDGDLGFSLGEVCTEGAVVGIVSALAAWLAWRGLSQR